MKSQNDLSSAARREFLGKLGLAAGCAGTAAAAVGALGIVKEAEAKSESSAGGASFPTPDYDWTKHRWGYGVDATKCIGCLRCVEACKKENHVAGDAHHFRTWVERYVY
ncbi:MAG TPA: 4Fe-4S binding protein, partial [Caldimonas sp.]